MTHNQVQQNISNCKSGSTSTKPQEQSLNPKVPESQETRPLRSPKARLYQKKEAWILQLALPNIDSNSVNVEERGQILYVYAENEQERFERSFKLPSSERFAKIQAELNQGLLSIEIHAEAPNSRKIVVQSAS